MMREFVDFLMQKIFAPQSVPDDMVAAAWGATIKDIRYHFPEWTETDIAQKVTSNSSELAVFLFRLGQQAHDRGLELLKQQLHGLMRQMCSCEIYFNNVIGEGFYVVHGLGTVVGSRNRIGKGFVIHQGCTIGHKKNGQGNGSVLGNDVKMYANASLIGELHIGDNVVIGGHAFVYKDLADSSVALYRN